MIVNTRDILVRSVLILDNLLGNQMGLVVVTEPSKNDSIGSIKILLIARDQAAIDSFPRTMAKQRKWITTGPKAGRGNHAFGSKIHCHKISR